MAVKASVNDVVQIKYPLLMTSDDERNILALIMDARGYGFEIISGRLNYVDGLRFDLSQFKPFPGSITLTNE